MLPKPKVHRTSRLVCWIGVSILSFCVLCSGVNRAFGDDQLPSGFKADRYQVVWQHNPFTLVTPAAPQAAPSPFEKLVLVSWLKDGGEDVIFVQNTDSNAVQKITSNPNKDNFRLLEMHLNDNPKLVEAVISNGSEQGTVKFHFEAPAPNLAANGQAPGNIPLPGNIGMPARPVFGNAPALPQNLQGGGRIPQVPGQPATQAPNLSTGQAMPQPNPGVLPSPGVPGQPEIRRKRLPPPNQLQQR
jgi:hypothetical protein